ncbi:hypothetical protein BH23BAC1_BH23BAC1_19670 [soil metagenome]
MKNIFKHILLVFFSLIILAACKKEDEEPVSVQEKLPVANAGDDATIAVGQKIELDGSKSNDPDGGTLTYLWALKTKPEGSTVTLVNADKIKAEFTPDLEGVFNFEITVNNYKKTAKDEVKLTVSSAPYTGCTVIESTINTNTTWTKRAPAGMVDYCVKANITVNATLTIEPGVIIEFDDNMGLYVDGGKIIAKDIKQWWLGNSKTLRNP